MDLDDSDLRPGWDPLPERLDDETVRYWLPSRRHGVAGKGDGWWRVIDRGGRPLSEHYCFEGAQVIAEQLEERKHSGEGAG